MRIARIEIDGAPVTAVIEGDVARTVSADVLDLLTSAPPERERRAAATTGEVRLDGARLLAPLEPATIRDFSVFEQHVEGASMATGGPGARVPDAWYERPAFYFSNPHVVSGPGAAVAAPPGSDLLDLELEVAVVIGRAGSDLEPGAAGAHIAGYTIFNDWSARDISAFEARMPFGFHKAKDFANTLGPWIVTPDELEGFRDGDRLDLRMQAFINDRPLGRDTLANMAWSFEELVALSSRGSAIAPGDVIASGTCGGGCLFELWGRNGTFDDPPPLRPGDEVRLEVEGIGTLVNHVVARASGPAPLPRARTGHHRPPAGSAP